MVHTGQTDLHDDVYPAKSELGTEIHQETFIKLEAETGKKAFLKILVDGENKNVNEYF